MKNFNFYQKISLLMNAKLDSCINIVICLSVKKLVKFCYILFIIKTLLREFVVGNFKDLYEKLLRLARK